MSSNLNGRSLEYLLVKLISDNNPNITISESTINAQNRDEANISRLNSELKTSMESSCLKIYEWIISELEELTEVIRFTDHQGTLGNPTDIKVISNFRENDLLNNGEGAPIAPIYHKHLIKKYKFELPCCFFFFVVVLMFM